MLGVEKRGRGGLAFLEALPVFRIAIVVGLIAVGLLIFDDGGVVTGGDCAASALLGPVLISLSRFS